MMMVHETYALSFCKAIDRSQGLFLCNCSFQNKMVPQRFFYNTGLLVDKGSLGIINRKNKYLGSTVLKNGAAW